MDHPLMHYRRESGSAQVANKATLNLILGVFLKLLGFFVVMYTYTDVNPVKARQAEESLRQQFNISVSLMREESKGNNPILSNQVLQKEGRSYIAIREELKTQLDFLSSRYLADSNQLVLSVPAEYAVALNDHPAKSPHFAAILSETLRRQAKDDIRYTTEIVVTGRDASELTRVVSVLVQQMIAADYPPELLSIGYAENDGPPMVEFHVTQTKIGDEA